MCRPIARSGQSSCRTKPACASPRTRAASRPRWRRDTPRGSGSGRSWKKSEITPGEAAVMKHVLGVAARERRREVLHVGLGRARSRTPIGPVQAGVLRRDAARIAEHALGHLREVHQVAVLQRMARAAEAGQPVLDVGRVARLAHLTVVDDGDAGLHLLPHGFGHRGADAGPEGRRVDGHAFLLREHHADQVRRPRETAGVGGEECVGAVRRRHGGAMLPHALSTLAGRSCSAFATSTVCAAYQAERNEVRASPRRCASRPACRTSTA